LDTAQQSRVLGMVFRPGGARVLIGASLHELGDRDVALEDLWGASAKVVRERLLAAPDAAARLFACESALRERLARSGEVAHPLAPLGPRACRARERHGVVQFGERLGWTVRRLEQVFRADVGLTPGAYQSLQRFRPPLVGVDGAARVGWSAFALEWLLRPGGPHSRVPRPCGLSPAA
jgi:hypothetical protein